MPKRKHGELEEDSLETGNVDQGDFSDGDESGDENDAENVDKYEMMKEDDIEGQEDPTQEFDGEIQITPFNMKEEMEEGDIDKEGTYIFGKREKDEVKDHWLDNIDWVKVNSQSASNKIPSDEESMDATDYLKKFDPIPAYKEMLTILLPGETVLKALKRLGGGKVQTASERWKKKKKQPDEEGNKESTLNKESIAKLTELANKILSEMGNMDIYQETFEGICYKVKKIEEVASKPINDLDMFGDMFDEKNKASDGSDKQKSESAENEPVTKKVRFEEGESQATTNEVKTSETVQWEFKWKQEDDSEVHGPHSTAEMLDWVNQGYFESGVWVRRVGQQGDFYTSRRIDFDLYL
ncbi:CD2 antigen cytoplasmic tail-binding protein 2 homolog [Daphnia carinata]|uniref:CD2 antigen cytoplasmic tail-binding protein 2 homolog n=1 Tax=Daphnia carinata TaxID=120202 RepID=UPI00257A3406|nr:CD2 antigen cytoplasmic tail-binding protein 2 homolog [Daphnia carinata]